MNDLEKLSNLDSNNIIFKEEKGWYRKIWNLISCSGKIIFIEYAPQIFRNILKKDKINQNYLNSSFNLLDNMKNISKLQISEGKSGSFFFFTNDNRFLIKTISKGERIALMGNFLQKYYDTINENENSSLLGRIYGLYTIKVGFFSSVDVILMENLCPISSEVEISINLVCGEEI